MKLAHRLVLSSLLLAAACASSDAEIESQRDRRRFGTATEALKYCAPGPVVEGVDISAYQPNVDWKALKASGREFAFIKITEGTGYVSSTFASQWAGAKSVGMVRGAYHFHRVDADPIAQADHFAGSLPPLEAGDMVMLDVEDAAHGGTPSGISANVKACADHIQQKTGRAPVIYTGMWYWQGHMGTPTGFTQFPMFIAAYPNTYAAAQANHCATIPDDFAKWAFWQYSSGPDPQNGTQLDAPPVPGIGSSCDRDFFNGTLAELKAFAGGAVAGPDWQAAFVAQSWPFASAPAIQMTVGQTLTGSVDFKNTGTKTWPAGVVKLAPIPRDVASELAAGSWVSPTRVAANAADVKPGQTAHFEWDLKAAKAGDFKPFFGLVAEGLSWFADSGGPPDNDIQVSIHVGPAAPMGAGGAEAAGGTGQGGKSGASASGGASAAGKGGSNAGGASSGVGAGGGKLGAGGTSASAGNADAGTSGESGAAAAAGSGGAPAAGVVNQDAPNDASSGCGCRVAKASPAPTGVFVLFGLGLLRLRRGRRPEGSAHPGRTNRS